MNYLLFRNALQGLALGVLCLVGSNAFAQAAGKIEKINGAATISSGAGARMAAIVGANVEVVGNIGKIASDLLQMSQFEIGGVQGLDALGCTACLTAAQSAPQRVATLLATLHQQHERALGAWQAEQGEWAQLVMLAHRSARSVAQMLAMVSFDSHRMQLHVDAAVSQLDSELAEKWFGAAQVTHAASLATHQLALWKPDFAA
jgi:hypothetical protein